MAAQLSHVYPLGSRVTEAGHLELGGCDAIDLAREFGTPAYVVVEDDVRERARAFVAAYAARCDDFEVHFASKAFPCTAVLRILREEGLACDVASGGELAIALKAGFDPARIHLHGNAKSAQEIAEAVGAGVGHVVVDNHTDIDLLEERRARPARCSACSCAWRPGSAPTRTRRSRRAARTRSSASGCSRRRPRSSASTRRTGSSSRACTCTSARRSTTSGASAPRWRRWRGWPRTAWSTSAAGSASRT